MKLLSSDLSNAYAILDELIIVINEHADAQKYVVVKKRIKISKKEVLRKAMFMCDKEKNLKSQEFERRETFTRVCECSFELIVILQSDD
jgi:hypothetical protein